MPYTNSTQNIFVYIEIKIRSPWRFAVDCTLQCVAYACMTSLLNLLCSWKSGNPAGTHSPRALHSSSCMLSPSLHQHTHNAPLVTCVTLLIASRALSVHAKPECDSIVWWQWTVAGILCSQQSLLIEGISINSRILIMGSQDYCRGSEKC